MNYPIRATAALTALAASIALSATAHADPVGDYLNVMRNSPGVDGGPINEAIYVNQGHRACDILRAGTSVEDTVNQLTGAPLYAQPWLARTMVTAAQQTLCPETQR